MTGVRRDLTAPTAEATRDVARALGALLRPGDAVALHGPLGAGKTEFVRGLVAGAGGDPADVSSPTFALVARYGGRVPVVHADLYRLDAASADYDLGLDEIADDAILAVEWAERAPSLLPPDRVEVTIEGEGEGAREIGLLALGPEASARLAALAV